MSNDRVHARRLSLFRQLIVWFGRCPRCGGRLEFSQLSELARGWTYSTTRYAARFADGWLNARPSHLTDPGEAEHCTSCGMWYTKGREYQINQRHRNGAST